MGLVSVEDALARLLDGVEKLPAETVALTEAGGRVLAEPVMALRTQPPFAASSMDGYALRAADAASVPARLRVAGVSAAGHPFSGSVAPGEAVRIFTGAPVPQGADAVVIQEDAQASGDGFVEIREPAVAGRYIRPAGLDFREGETLLEAGRTLDPAALSLAASANHARLSVHTRPLVAFLATGDELLPPGSALGPGQIISANGAGIAALIEAAGARALDLGIAPDLLPAIAEKVEAAVAAKADVLVTLGGASVGDHDLVHAALTDAGMTLDFWKIALRPGKPLMAGRLGAMRCLGLPGNPVSSLVCSHVFLKPLIDALLGRSDDAKLRRAVLGAALPANDQRQDYLRARAEMRDGELVATAFPRQDSSMLRLLADANALVVRAPFAPAAEAGEPCDILMLR